MPSKKSLKKKKKEVRFTQKVKLQNENRPKLLHAKSNPLAPKSCQKKLKSIFANVLTACSKMGF
jgi:hypothetical protein